MYLCLIVLSAQYSYWQEVGTTIIGTIKDWCDILWILINKPYYNFAVT